MDRVSCQSGHSHCEQQLCATTSSWISFLLKAAHTWIGGQRQSASKEKRVRRSLFSSGVRHSSSPSACLVCQIHIGECGAGRLLFSPSLYTRCHETNCSCKTWMGEALKVSFNHWEDRFFAFISIWAYLTFKLNLCKIKAHTDLHRKINFSADNSGLQTKTTLSLTPKINIYVPNYIFIWHIRELLYKGGCFSS